MNEKDLVKKSQNGDKNAFEDLIRMFYPYVSGFLLKNTNNNDLAEDLTQETFLKMVQNIEKYDLKSKVGFGTWLITIAKNCYIDYLRKNKVIISDIQELQIDDGSDISEDVIVKMEYEQVNEIINSLPPEQGIAIRMKYEENLTLEEIANKFGVKPKTIKSRIFDGKRKIRKIVNANKKGETL